MTETASVTGIKSFHQNPLYFSEDTIAGTTKSFGRIVNKGFEKDGLGSLTSSYESEDINCNQLRFYIHEKGLRTIARDICTFSGSDIFVDVFSKRSLLVSENASWLIDDGLIALAPSSSKADNIDEDEIREVIKQFLEAYSPEDIEDGYESDFFLELGGIIRTYSDNILKAIAEYEITSSSEEQLLSKALYHLGDLNHSPTHVSRLHLLEKLLNSSSRWIRDGAALGLEAMDDVHAIPYIEQAIQTEKILDLKNDLEQVLDSLKK